MPPACAWTLLPEQGLPEGVGVCYDPDGKYCLVLDAQGPTN